MGRKYRELVPLMRQIQKVVKLFGLSVALVILALAAGNRGYIGLAQRTITVCPSGCSYTSIQEAINAASDGDTIQILPGTYKENLWIHDKKLTLRGAGAEKTVLDGAGHEPEGIGIKITGGARMMIDDLTVRNYDEGLDVRDSATVSLSDSAVSSNEYGLVVRDSATVSLSDSTISGNREDGLFVEDSAIVSLSNSAISSNIVRSTIGLASSGSGLDVRDSATVSLSDSQVSGNGVNGLVVRDSATVSLSGSTVSRNESNGLLVVGSVTLTINGSRVSENGVAGLNVRDSAQATIKESTIEKNGFGLVCGIIIMTGRVCNGIVVVGKSQTTIIDSKIIDNADWGVGAWLKKCGVYEDDFTGKVIFEGNNQIYGNGKGDVCLP